MRKLGGCLGVAVALISAPLAAVGVVGLLSGDDPAGMVLLTVFFGGTFATGGYFAKRNLLAPPPVPTALLPESLEHTTLAHAASLGGRITVAELALMGKVPVAAAKEALDALVRQGVADVLVNAEGATVYDFPELMRAKARALPSGDREV